jgi:hypothetical protein
VVVIGSAGALVVVGCGSRSWELSDGLAVELEFFDVSGGTLRGRDVTLGDVEEGAAWFGGLVPAQPVASSTIASTTLALMTPRLPVHLVVGSGW